MLSFVIHLIIDANSAHITYVYVYLYCQKKEYIIDNSLLETTAE